MEALERGDVSPECEALGRNVQPNCFPREVCQSQEHLSLYLHPPNPRLAVPHRATVSHDSRRAPRLVASAQSGTELEALVGAVRGADRKPRGIDGATPPCAAVDRKTFPSSQRVAARRLLDGFREAATGQSVKSRHPSAMPPSVVTCGHCGYESAQSRSSGIFVVVLVGDANNGERPSLQLTDDVKWSRGTYRARLSARDPNERLAAPAKLPPSTPSTPNACLPRRAARSTLMSPGLSGDHLGTWLEDKMAAPGQSPRRDGASERRASLSSPPAPPDRPTLASAVHEGL
ncbi:unnamed protein product [Lampetra planeri]